MVFVRTSDNLIRTIPIFLTEWSLSWLESSSSFIKTLGHRNFQKSSKVSRFSRLAIIGVAGAQMFTSLELRTTTLRLHIYSTNNSNPIFIILPMTLSPLLSTSQLFMIGLDYPLLESSDPILRSFDLRRKNLKVIHSKPHCPIS